MTAADLRALAARLAESTWVRTWADWPNPHDEGLWRPPPDWWPRGTPLLALSLRPDPEDLGYGVELRARGFRPAHADEFGWVYVTERTGEEPL